MLFIVFLGNVAINQTAPGVIINGAAPASREKIKVSIK